MSASDDDDITLAAKAMAQAALAAFVLFLVVLICQLAAPATRTAQNAASRNEQTFAALSARHGRDAARQVVYERDGRRFYYPTAQSGEEEIP